MGPSTGAGDPSRRRSAQIARIEALRRETTVGRYQQRLIEPAAWGWFALTFFASSVAMAGAGVVAEHLPRELAVVLTGVALFLAVVVVDSVFASAGGRPPAAPTAVASRGQRVPPAGTAAAVTTAFAWTIRLALILIVLAGAAFVALLRFAPEAPVLDRVATFLDEQRAAIAHSLRAASERPAVRGRTAGSNWQLLARDGHYVAAPLAEAKQLCATLGAGWKTPRLEDFARLEPPPDEPGTLHVWVSRAVDQHEWTATSAEIHAGSWQPTGFLSSPDTSRDHFLVLCVRAGV